jgi:hypothetical protein
MTTRTITPISRRHLTLVTPTSAAAPAPPARPSGWDAPPLAVAVVALTVTLTGVTASLALAVAASLLSGRHGLAACTAVVGITGSALTGMALTTRLAPGSARPRPARPRPARPRPVRRQGALDTQPAGTRHLAPATRSTR